MNDIAWIQCRWLLLLDLVGSLNKWPVKIVRLFWSRHLRYLGRFQVAAFCVVNGIDPTLIYEWVSKRKMLKDHSAERHFCGILSSLEKSTHSEYYAYNVSWGRIEFCDGRVRN